MAVVWTGKGNVACFGSRGICEIVLDGGGRFVPADIVRVHTMSLLLSSQVAHDRATEDNHTQQGKIDRNGTTTELLVGTVHKPRQGGIKSVPL